MPEFNRKEENLDDAHYLKQRGQGQRNRKISRNSIVHKNVGKHLGPKDFSKDF